MGTFDELKDKYQQGYRCIYSQKDDKQGMTMHLKNFVTEKVYTIQSNDTMEIGKMEDFLDELDAIRKQNGHDCHSI